VRRPDLFFLFLFLGIHREQTTRENSHGTNCDHQSRHVVVSFKRNETQNCRPNDPNRKIGKMPLSHPKLPMKLSSEIREKLTRP
jgi:hypothetical protein